jgi:hypothetical protein
MKKAAFAFHAAASQRGSRRMSAPGPNEFRCDGRFYALFNLPSNATEDDIRREQLQCIHRCSCNTNLQGGL